MRTGTTTQSLSRHPASQPIVETRPCREAALIASHLCRFLSVIAVIWALFFAISELFPFIRSGANIIYDAKIGDERGATLLPADHPLTVLVFGNSKVLSGFIPSTFDATLRQRGFSAYSYNLGLPDADRFIADLETLAARGQAPKIALITLPWKPAVERPTFFKPILSDRTVVDTVFPFRHLLRDVALFFALSHSRGGPVAFYRQGQEIVQRMRVDRGYYFIAGQSHYPGDRLPDNFHLQGDTPNTRPDRTLNFASSEFSRLRSLLIRYRIRCYLVPSYFRQQEHAPASAANSMRILWTEPAVSALGPDYFTFPNRLFADPAHLNPTGAQEYTLRLAALVADALTLGPQ